MDIFCQTQPVPPKYSSTITLTFGDAGENHQGMEIQGVLGDVGSGYTPRELGNSAFSLLDLGYDVEVHNLSLDPSPDHAAAILIIRNYLDVDNGDSLFTELKQLHWDTKYKCPRRGRVLNKHARSNLVILDGISEEASYENGRGTIIDGYSIPVFNEMKTSMTALLNRASNTDKANNLVCEGNQYTSPTTCGIGFHGDAERRKVIALRLGNTMPMHWQWFHRSKPIGNPYKFTLHHGDLYIMSEKAVGNDWRFSSRHTLRHAAGADKYLSLEKYKKE